LEAEKFFERDAVLIVVLVEEGEEVADRNSLELESEEALAGVDDVAVNLYVPVFDLHSPFV
jgi:hypothetical protein